MHTDLSPHLHTDECNKIIAEYKKCQSENPFFQFLGSCGDLDARMVMCLKKERLTRRAENSRKASEKLKQIQEKLREDFEKKQQGNNN